ncbi:MAG: hypothetical protein HOV81_15315 [Kofleriaceae bacterium]|nr:hypothetical protein [Kofleriaceae bacterium]
MKVLKSCGCAVLVKVDGSADSIQLLKIDLLGCRAGEADDQVAALVEPLVDPNAREQLRDFINRPRVFRDDAQTRQFAALQSSEFGHVGVRVLFGAAGELNVGAARRTIWLEPFVSQASERLIPDTPIAPPCRLVPREPHEFESKGYCDSAPQEQSPCNLDHVTRSRYRSEVALRVGHTLSEWRAAVRTVSDSGLLDSKHAPEALARSLVGVLPDRSQEVGLSEASIRTGATALQLAAEAAGDWRDRLIWRLDYLTDVDLASLMLELPSTDEPSSRVFVERIKHRLKP